MTSGDRIAAERLLEPARAEEGVDLEGLSLDRLLDWRVVQQRHDLGRSQTGQRGFELQGFVHRLTDELFDGSFAPRAQGALTESSRESFHPGDADATYLARISVEDASRRRRR